MERCKIFLFSVFSDHSFFMKDEKLNLSFILGWSFLNVPPSPLFEVILIQLLHLSTKGICKKIFFFSKVMSLPLKDTF